MSDLSKPVCFCSTVPLPDGIVIGGLWPNTVITWPGGQCRRATKPEHDLFHALEATCAKAEREKQELKQQMVGLRREVQHQQNRADAHAEVHSSASPFAQRAADALAYQCARAVRLGHIGSRSGIADALLDYLNVGRCGGPLDVVQWMLEYKQGQSPNAPASATEGRP